MFEQVKEAFPLGRVQEYTRLPCFIVLLSALHLDVYPPDTHDVYPVWKVCSSSVGVGTLTITAPTLTEARDKFYAQVRKDLREFSHKVRTDIAPPVVPLKVPPLPEGMDWIKRGKNRWDAKVGPHAVRLRFCARKKLWEFGWDVTDYQPVFIAPGEDMKPYLRKSAWFKRNHLQGSADTLALDASAWQEVAECLNK